MYGGRHDLLLMTGRTPHQDMRDQFRIARDHGMDTVRDGLFLATMSHSESVWLTMRAFRVSGICRIITGTSTRSGARGLWHAPHWLSPPKIDFPDQ